MPDKHSDSLQLISLMLQYPDENLLQRLDGLAAIACRARPSYIRSAALGFLKELGGLTSIQAQERYTALFDMEPAMSLNVTFHTYGNNEKRAVVLARLQHQYDQAGWERITGELPDYLPMMLEFLAICNDAEQTAFVWQCLHGLGPLIEALEARAPTYACLLRPIAKMAADHGASIENDALSFEETS